VVDDEMKPEGAAAVEKLVTVDRLIARRRHVERRASGPDPDYEKYEKVTVWIGRLFPFEQAWVPMPWYFHLHPGITNRAGAILKGGQRSPKAS
jgi:hypothetical protein